MERNPGFPGTADRRNHPVRTRETSLAGAEGASPQSFPFRWPPPLPSHLGSGNIWAGVFPAVFIICSKVCFYILLFCKYVLAPSPYSDSHTAIGISSIRARE